MKTDLEEGSICLKIKTLLDSKPKRCHIYMSTENKAKSHKDTILNIFVYYQYKILLQQTKIG